MNLGETIKMSGEEEKGLITSKLQSREVELRDTLREDLKILGQGGTKKFFLIFGNSGLRRDLWCRNFRGESPKSGFKYIKN